MSQDFIPVSSSLLELGGLLEAHGVTPIGGRIFGLLLLRGTPQSLDQIVEATGASKASVSQNARQLEREGLVQRLVKPGDRKDYYGLGSRGSTRPAELLADQLRAMARAYRGACDRGEAATAKARNHLRLCASLFDHVATAMEGQLSEWRARVGS